MERSFPTANAELELIELAEAQEQAEWGHVGHGRGVARIAQHLAQALYFDFQMMDELSRAARLHDVGKVALDSSLWGDLGLLTAEQRVIMEAHSQLGADLVAQAGLPESIQRAIRHHHEHWDGSGYPDKLTGEQIPLTARILCLSEHIDSMMRATYRRQSVSPDEMYGILETRTGHEWDPNLARLVEPIIRGR
jgi:putative nucleotidyltransferase with HDIG domain